MNAPSPPNCLPGEAREIGVTALPAGQDPALPTTRTVAPAGTADGTTARLTRARAAAADDTASSAHESATMSSLITPEPRAYDRRVASQAVEPGLSPRQH